MGEPPGFLTTEKSTALLIQAVAQRRLSPAKENVNNPWLWKKISLILRDLERELFSKSVKIAFEHTTAILACSDVENLGDIRDAAATLKDQYVRSILPWRKPEKAEDERESAIEQFERIFGKPGEKQYEENIRKAKEAIANGPEKPTAD